MRFLSLFAILIGAGCATHGSTDYGTTSAVYSENPVHFEGRFAPASALDTPERADQPYVSPSENPVFDFRFTSSSTGEAPQSTPSPEFFAESPGYSGN